jgi:hypothetical protein
MSGLVRSMLGYASVFSCAGWVDGWEVGVGVSGCVRSLRGYLLRYLCPHRAACRYLLINGVILHGGIDLLRLISLRQPGCEPPAFMGSLWPPYNTLATSRQHPYASPKLKIRPLEMCKAGRKPLPPPPPGISEFGTVRH